MLDGSHEFALCSAQQRRRWWRCFVAASIGAGYISAERGSPTRTFTTPVVFHYTFVLFLSLVSLIPSNTDTSFDCQHPNCFPQELAEARKGLVFQFRSA